MTNYEFGGIVLVDFPQAAPVRSKRRPALIILDIGDADIVLAPITTKEHSGRGDYKLRDWQVDGLLRESWLRVAKIACLQKSDIIRCLGRLTDYDMDMVSKLWQTVYVFPSGTQRNLSMKMRHLHKEFSVAMDHYFLVPVY